MDRVNILNRLGLPKTILSGQTAVVTGAGRGIGAEAARGLAWFGARVIVAELDVVSGSETASTILREGGEALFVETDVSSGESVAALAARVHAAFGAVDILINNAIVCPVVGVTEMELGLWEQVMGVNLRGAFLTTRTFLPEMLARKHGTIVNMISTDAMPGLSAYIASKQGLTGFSKSVALETTGQGVNVIPFAPGMVDTPGIRGVATGLAPRLGLSEEQFLQVPLHPAFEGLMPVEYAGAATVCLAAAYAADYHGEAVNGYTILERAGVIQADNLAVENVGAVEDRGLTTEIPVLLAELERILAETGAEFDKLPVFARPMARGGFKGKAGMSLGDWQRLAASLRSGHPAGADLPARLEKLAGYYRDVPRETARFTRDEEVLREVARVCKERIGTIEAIIKGIAGGG